MGSSHSKIQGNYSLPGPLHLKLQAKIARFNKMREVFAKALQPLKSFPQLQPLSRTLIRHLKITTESSEIPLMQLHSFLLGNLGQNIYQDKESLKQKRNQLFQFVHHNLLSHSTFIIPQLLAILNKSIQTLIPTLKYQKLPMMKVIINSVLDLFNSLLTWMYGEEIFHVFLDKKVDEDTREYIVELYRNELAEFIVFYEDEERTNQLLRLRNLEVQFVSIKIKNSLGHKQPALKKVMSLKEELLQEEQLGYNAIVKLLERIAKASLFTSKYKLLSILFDTIPQLYLQEQLKNIKDLHRSNSLGGDKHNKWSISDASLLKKPFQIQTMLSTMLSTDKKREISRVMLNEWLLFTKRDIIVQILVPLKLLQQDGYIQEPQHFLHAFMHGLYQLLEVDDTRHSDFL